MKDEERTQEATYLKDIAEKGLKEELDPSRKLILYTASIEVMESFDKAIKEEAKKRFNSLEIQLQYPISFTDSYKTT